MSRGGGPWVVPALPGRAAIETGLPVPDIAEAVRSGTIVVIQGACDAGELLRTRAAIVAWNAPDGPNDRDAAASSRQRSEDPPDTPIRHVFESYLFGVNAPHDPIGPAVRPTFERLAAFWRRLSGQSHGFVPDAAGLALRARALHYPAGGGYFDWHEHPLEPHRVGLILGVSRQGVDFRTGATEFRTPHGEVSTAGVHDLGDLCLFRYDLPHRVTAVDPERGRRWDASGRWTFILPVQ